jgi:magnesium transporter
MRPNLWRRELMIFQSDKEQSPQRCDIRFMEDLKKTVLRVFENIESLKSILTDLLNIYSTHVNHKLNEVMKILTIFSAIFIPLTFIAGIYGTNFDYLPELKFKYSYFWMLGIMLVLAIGMVIFFKRKRWL